MYIYIYIKGHIILIENTSLCQQCYLPLKVAPKLCRVCNNSYQK